MIFYQPLAAWSSFTLVCCFLFFSFKRGSLAFHTNQPNFWKPTQPPQPTCKFYLQILLTNFTCKFYLQILLANFTCKLYLQILLANFTCKFYLQILLANFTCKFYLQILLANSTCKFYLQFFLLSCDFCFLAIVSSFILL